jgi:hypothetical protein
LRRHAEGYFRNGIIRRRAFILESSLYVYGICKVVDSTFAKENFILKNAGFCDKIKIIKIKARGR